MRYYHISKESFLHSAASKRSSIVAKFWDEDGYVTYYITIDSLPLSTTIKAVEQEDFETLIRLRAKNIIVQKCA